MLKLLKLIFIPSFTHEIFISIVDLHFTEEIRRKLRSFGVEKIEVNENGYFFEIKTCEMVNLLRKGVSHVLVTYLEDKNSKISIYYKSRKDGLYIIPTAILSIYFLILITDQISFLYLPLVIALIAVENHLYSYSYKMKNHKRIKNFFYNLIDD